MILFLLPLQGLNAQHSEHGTVDFGVSCGQSVQADFDRSLAMLHNMIYVTSREAFEQIVEANPDCAMAYWGIATTLFQPLWGTRPDKKDLLRGWRNIEKAMELVESGREEYLIEATGAFFRDPESADFWSRIERWSDVMEAAYEVYPDDRDISAFYGLTRLALAQRSENRNLLYDEAEEILREIYQQVPTHPGAIHYSIHATDVDGRAENALDMVDAYGKIAPTNPHALHMPSHIYVRLGDWPEVIQWNLKSAEAALNYSVNGAVSHHYVHANDYLVYAYLQGGEDPKVEPVVREVGSIDRYQASFVSAFHFAAIPARVAVERRDWGKAADLKPRTPGYLPWDASPWAEGMTWFAKGLGAVHTGEPDAANKAEQQLQKFRDGAKREGAEDMATYIEIERRVLAGWIAYSREDEEKAVEFIRSAAELESSTEKHPVTPGALLPPNEALGDLLMEIGRPAQALKAYERSNAIWPERYNTLLGAARAARSAGDNLAAQKYYEKLLDNAGGSERIGIEEAEGFIASQ